MRVQVWQRNSGAKPPRPTASAPQAAARPPRPPQPAAAHVVADACDATGGTARQLRGAISGEWMREKRAAEGLLQGH